MRRRLIFRTHLKLNREYGHPVHQVGLVNSMKYETATTPWVSIVRSQGRYDGIENLRPKVRTETMDYRPRFEVL